MSLHPARGRLFRVWLGEELEFRPGPSFRTLEDATRFARTQPQPELCSIECPDGGWISPTHGLVREVQIDEAPLEWVTRKEAIDGELRRYLTDEPPQAVPRSNRRSSQRIPVQNRAELVLNPGRVLGARRPLLHSMVANASETGLGLRIVAAKRPIIQPHDPLWVRIDNSEELELPARIAWCKNDSLGVRIRLADGTLEERYQRWLRRAGVAGRPGSES